MKTKQIDQTVQVCFSLSLLLFFFFSLKFEYQSSLRKNNLHYAHILYDGQMVMEQNE